MMMSALMSTPSNEKANRTQKCSLDMVWLSGKRARGDAKGSCCRADLFLGPLVCKAVGERRVQHYHCKLEQYTAIQ